MKYIKLTQNKQVKVDDEDFEVFNQFKWHYLESGYAARRDLLKNRKYIYMHRLIMGFSDSEIDHIDQDKLNNQRNNLRIVTRSQNMANTILRKTNSTGFKGVYFIKDRKKWEAAITVNYKKIYLGRFNDKLEAAKAYNEAAIKYFGEFAVLNPI